MTQQHQSFVLHPHEPNTSVPSNNFEHFKLFVTRRRNLKRHVWRGARKSGLLTSTKIRSK